MPEISDDAMMEATGRTRAEWFKLLDKWGARDRAHQEIAEHLASRHRVPGWWAQMVTVEYERARGLRAVGQRASGTYEASVRRTIEAPATRVEALLLDEGARLDPILGAQPKASDTNQGRVLRYREGDDRVQIVVTPKDDGRTVVIVVHGGLPTQTSRVAAKARWVKVIEAVSGLL